MCHFWHNFDGPFYSNNGTYGTLPLMVYIHLPFLAHLCIQYPIGAHVPFQPNMAQNSFPLYLGDNCFVPLLECTLTTKYDRQWFWATYLAIFGLKGTCVSIGN